MNKTIYPELLGKHANPDSITDWVKILSVTENRNAMIQELKSADSRWRNSQKNPVKVIADDILS